MTDIFFIPLNESHFPLMHVWFNKPHVQSFYSLRSWTLEEVHHKLTQQQHIEGFIAYANNMPLGYIQSYPIKEYPWENQDLPPTIIRESAGFDLFIGEEAFLHKGIGFLLVNHFLNTIIWPRYTYCLTDPDIRNTASIHLFEKCGFTKHKQIPYQNPLHQPVTLQLYIKQRPMA